MGATYKSVTQPSLPTPIPLRDRNATAGTVATNPTYVVLGRCMAEVKGGFGLSLKEFAAELGLDRSHVARQMKGLQRPQIEAVFAVERFQAPMAVAMARAATGVDVDTVFRIRRSA